MSYIKTLYIFIGLFFLGCSGVPTNVYTPGPDIKRNWDWSSKFPEYNAYAKRAIIKYGSSLQNTPPEDVTDFCPDYFKLSVNDRLSFWTKFLSALSYEESNHNNQLEYREKFEDNFGNKVISTGLFQLSYESSQSYDCNISRHADLKNPQANIDCAIKILNTWIYLDNRIAGREFDTYGKWIGGARYWSVLRKSHTKQRIINNLKTLNYPFQEKI